MSPLYELMDGLIAISPFLYGAYAYALLLRATAGTPTDVWQGGGAGGIATRYSTSLSLSQIRLPVWSLLRAPSEISGSSSICRVILPPRFFYGVGSPAAATADGSGGRGMLMAG